MHFQKSFILALPLLASADVNRCATKQPNSGLQKLHASQAKIDDTNRLNNKENTHPKVSINTFVHIISKGSAEAEGNSAQESIVDQVRSPPVQTYVIVAYGTLTDKCSQPRVQRNWVHILFEKYYSNNTERLVSYLSRCCPRIHSQVNSSPGELY